MSDELWRLSAVETAEVIRTKKNSCVEITEAHLARMAAKNPSVNAVTTDLSSQALEAAALADKELAAGQIKGPLHGVPVTIKENVDMVGCATANGIPALSGLIAEANSPVVDNLLNVGAIIIGRTNPPEFSLRWFSDNPLHGKTLNPWNDKITPGGSSGGASASVALGIGCIAQGNDLGGSLRYPAYCCGLSTIRPSMGRVPAYNPTGAEERPPIIQTMSVQGPIARTVADVRLALQVMSKGDHRDPWWVPAPFDGPAEDGPIKVAVCDDPADEGVHPAVTDAIRLAAEAMAKDGYVVEKVSPPAGHEISEMWGSLLDADAQMMMGAAMKKIGSPDINQIFDHISQAYKTVDFEAYMRMAADRTRLWREWATFMQDYPLVLAPVSQKPPFPQDLDLGGFDAVKEILKAQRMLVAVNMLGLPAASVPTDLCDNIPMGVQIIGRRFRDDQCLDAAEAVEKATGILSHKLWERG